MAKRASVAATDSECAQLPDASGNGAIPAATRNGTEVEISHRSAPCLIRTPLLLVDPWQIKAVDFPAKGTGADKLSFLLNYAVLAPSILNVQPWLRIPTIAARQSD